MNFDAALNMQFFRLFTKRVSLEAKLHQEKLESLRLSIEDSKSKLRLAHENFNNVTEPKLIDFYIYKIQAEQSRYEQLLKEYRLEEQQYIPSAAEHF